MSNPLVSIVIPVYNAARYLEDAIRSAMEQTWPNKEILIVNDGSTDGSLAIAKKYVSENIKVFSQANAGASAARNKGISEAKGNYIQFLDADDIIAPSKIEVQLKSIINLPDAIAYGPYANFADVNALPFYTESYLKTDYPNGNSFLFDLYGGSKGNFSTGGMIPTVCWLLSKSLIEKTGGWNENLSLDDDGEFFCRAVIKAQNIKYSVEAKSYYRTHTNDNNLSSQSSYKAWLSAFNAMELKNLHINDKKFNPLLANQAIQLLVNIYPRHQELQRKIDAFIKDLGGNVWQPYQENPHKIFRMLFGWRFVKLLTHYKNK